MPSEAWIGVGVFIALVALIFIGIQVFISMLFVAFVGLWLIGGPNFVQQQLIIAPYSLSNDYLFAVIPLFLLMGELAAQTGMADKAFDALNKWIGKIRGGLLMATMGANAIFGAVSAAPISTMMLSIRVALPQLLKQKYDENYCLAAIIAAGTLDALIPPSTMVLIFCLLTGVSIGKALVAGIIPGIALTFLFAISIFIYGRIYPEKVPVVEMKATWKERFSSLTTLWPIFSLFLLIIGGIYLGIFPPTAGGAMGALAVLIYALVCRTDKHKIFGAFREVILMNCQIFPIIISGFIFGRVIALSHLADYLTEFVVNLQVPPLLVMAAVIIVYILISFPLEFMPAMVITLPIFFPLLTNLGFSPLVVCVVITVLATVANFTPPTGVAVYVAASLAKVNVADIWKSVIPWFVMLLIFLWIIVLWPPLTTWLPDLFYK